MPRKYDPRKYNAELLSVLSGIPDKYVEEATKKGCDLYTYAYCYKAHKNHRRAMRESKMRR